MRSADQIINEYLSGMPSNHTLDHSECSDLIKVAQREAISESAKNAEMYVDSSKSPYGSEVSESILQLLNQIQ